MTFIIIAYPHGEQARVGIVHGRGVEDARAAACTQARMRGEYVDIEQDGRCIDVCDGVGSAYGQAEFRAGS